MTKFLSTRKWQTVSTKELHQHLLTKQLSDFHQAKTLQQ